MGLSAMSSVQLISQAPGGAARPILSTPGQLRPGHAMAAPGQGGTPRDVDTGLCRDRRRYVHLE